MFYDIKFVTLHPVNPIIMTISQIKGHVAMLGANIMWGLMSPIVKYVIGLGVITPLLMTDFRIFGAAILFWSASFFVERQHVSWTDKGLLFIAGMMGILFNQGCFIFGVGFSSPGEASIITTTMPMWVMVFARLILGEPITLKKAGGIALGATGALILITSSMGSVVARGQNPVLGDMLVLAGQISYALYLTFYRNFIKKYSLITNMKWMFLSASIVLLPISYDSIRNTSFELLSGLEWAGIAYVMVFATFLAYICIMTGQRTLRPTVVGMYNYFQPIVASAIGLYLGMDRFTPLKLFAVVLIFSGVYFVVISKSKE